MVVAGSTFYLRSAHGSYLSCKQDGTPHVHNQQDKAEQWTAIESGGKLLIKNVNHGTHLGAKPGDGDQVYTSGNTQAWEQWSVEKKDGGKICLVSAHNTVIGCDDKHKLYMIGHRQAWEQWDFEYVGLQFGVQYKIVSWKGTNLGARDDFKDNKDGGSLYVSSNDQAWEHWTIKSAGGSKVFIVTAHGTNLGARPGEGNNAYHHTNSQAWEQWTMVSNGKGQYHLKSEHGTHLGTDGDKIYLHPNKQAWETWAFTHIA